MLNFKMKQNTVEDNPWSLTPLTFNNISVILVVVSLIGGGNRTKIIQVTFLPNHLLHWLLRKRLNINKRKYKQRWSTIPPISTKQTTSSHLKPLNIKQTMTHDVGNPSPGTHTNMGQDIIRKLHVSKGQKLFPWYFLGPYWLDLINWCLTPTLAVFQLSVLITTKVVSFNSGHGEVYLIMFVSDLSQVVSFLRVIRFPP
jgi:hypothetical protein